MRRGKKICSPSQGIEPWSPAWQAGILATILWRTLLVADVIRPCNNHIPYVQNPYTHTHTQTHTFTHILLQPTNTHLHQLILPSTTPPYSTHISSHKHSPFIHKQQHLHSPTHFLTTMSNCHNKLSGSTHLSPPTFFSSHYFCIYSIYSEKLRC